MSDTVKVNPDTGQVAVKRGDSWHIYDRTLVKINQQTGQLAVPDAQASGYEIHDAPDSVSLLSRSRNAMSIQDPLAGIQPQTNPADFSNALHTSAAQPSLPNDRADGQGESALRALSQGISFTTQDEINAAVQGLMGKAFGVQSPIDPNHPVTGGMDSGFVANYRNAAKDERAANTAAKESNPKTYKSALFAGALLPSLAMPARTVLQAGLSGAVQGGILGAGSTDQEDLRKVLFNTGLGAGTGGLLGAGTRALQAAAFDTNTPSGLAYNALNAASEGDPGNIQVRPSSAPAETDPRMAELLRAAGSVNGPAASAAIPGARARMAGVNDAIFNEINNQLSPDDAALLLERIQQNAQTANNAAYTAARANPTRVGLVPEITQRPSFQEALQGAQAHAADEWPPRQVDPTDLGSIDMELIDKALSRSQRLAGQTHGVDSQAALNQQMRIDTRGEVQNAVRQVADQAYPELAQARQGAAEAFGLENAVETAGGWFKSTTSAEQVGHEFNQMTPGEQQAALAKFATDLRNTLSTKTARQNISLTFEKYGVADKLLNLGVPQETIDAITRGGSGARQMLDALVSGSMTARNLATKEAMQSTLSSVKPGDITAGAVTGSPAVTAALPILRNIGDNATREAAARLVNALVTPGGRGLVSIINRAPQSWGGLLNAVPRTAGSLLPLGMQGMQQ